jgi:hypothetical protein
VDTIDAYRREAVLQCIRADCIDVGEGCVWLEERVVDKPSDIGEAGTRAAGHGQPTSASIDDGIYAVGAKLDRDRATAPRPHGCRADPLVEHLAGDLRKYVFNFLSCCAGEVVVRGHDLGVGARMAPFDLRDFLDSSAMALGTPGRGQEGAKDFEGS